MNGATLFGVGLTLAALAFLEIFNQTAKKYFFIGAGIYGIGAMLAFVFPKLSGE